MRGLPGQPFAAPTFHYQVGGVSGGFLVRRLLGSAISNATGFALGVAVAPTLQPFTQSVANEAWSAFPHKPIAAGSAAEAALRGFVGDGTARGEASQTGFDGGRFDMLKRLAGEAPPLETLLALRRRGVISPGELGTGIQQLGYLDEWRGHLAALGNVLPSVTDMVRFAVREVYDPAKRSALDLDAEFPDAFATDAQRIGLSRETSGQYWAAHWELPSYTQGAQMMFRGEISPGQFDTLLKALDYAPVWRGPLSEIARAIPSLSDMIRFAVREVYNPPQRQALGLDADYPPEFTAQARKHGMVEADARDYWAAHWRLPSAQQGYRMLWRGEITEAQLAGLLKALDYSQVWRDRLQAIAYLVPGRIDLKRMFRFGILTRAQVKAGYQRLGYQPQDAEFLTQIAEHEALTSTTGSPWAQRARSSLFTAAHEDYVDGNADEAASRRILTAIGATVPEQNTVIQLWATEIAETRRDLTQAQVLKLVKADVWTEAQGQAALEDLGMTAADATALLATTR